MVKIVIIWAIVSFLISFKYEGNDLRFFNALSFLIFIFIENYVLPYLELGLK